MSDGKPILKMPHNYKAVIFDWDGTIVDSLDFVFSAHNHVRDLHGLPLWSRDDFKTNMKYSSREIYPTIYGEKSPDAIAALVRYTEENYQKFITLFKGARELLDGLRAAEIPIAVVSNMRHAALAQQITMLNLEGYFAVVAGSGYADKDKPDGAPLLKALAEMKMMPGLTYFMSAIQKRICFAPARHVALSHT
jgi:phosphoglycolate phosphatase